MKRRAFLSVLGLAAVSMPPAIGTAASPGCIRMLNKDVVELFDDNPLGTKVIVQ